VHLRDDGVGFDTSVTTEGIGLENMRSRITDLGGELEIKSSNTGTIIIMYIPIHKN